MYVIYVCMLCTYEWHGVYVCMCVGMLCTYVSYLGYVCMRVSLDGM